MLERSKKKRDVDALMDALTSGSLPKTADGKDPLAVALGRRGGLKGGPARIALLDAKGRKALAKKAAAARWSKQEGEEK